MLDIQKVRNNVQHLILLISDKCNSFSFNVYTNVFFSQFDKVNIFEMQYWFLRHIYNKKTEKGVNLNQ